MSSTNSMHLIEESTGPSKDAPTGASVADKDNTNNSSKKRKVGKSKSAAWNYFTKVINEKGERQAQCNYCETKLAADPKLNDTTSLNSHVRTCKHIPRGSTDPKQSELVIPFQGEGPLGFGKYSHEELTKDIAEMIINHEMPFKFVDTRGFQKILSRLCPKFRIPSRWTTARDCFGIYLEEKKKLYTFLKSSSTTVSLTTDSWTSLQRENYLCLTCHFIDNNWTLQKRIINFCPINSHKGEDIGKVLEKCLREWGIDKVFTVTVDNASSNDVAVVYLRKKLNNVGGTILEGKFMHMRCVAHIINLVVTEGLREVNDSIARVRGAVKFVRQSPARLKRFKECIELEKIESKALLSTDC